MDGKDVLAELLKRATRYGMTWNRDEEDTLAAYGSYKGAKEEARATWKEGATRIVLRFPETAHYVYGTAPVFFHRWLTEEERRAFIAIRGESGQLVDVDAIVLAGESGGMPVMFYVDSGAFEALPLK